VSFRCKGIGPRLCKQVACQAQLQPQFDRLLCLDALEIEADAPASRLGMRVGVGAQAAHVGIAAGHGLDRGAFRQRLQARDLCEGGLFGLKRGLLGLSFRFLSGPLVLQLLLDGALLAQEFLTRLVGLRTL